MQLALTPEVLFPLVAGAVVVIAVITVIVVLSRGKRTADADDSAAAPTAADWTGEAATGDPSAVAARRAAPQPAYQPAPRPTVAEAMAVREADTAPLPVSSAAFVRSAPVAAGAAPLPEGPAGPLTADPGPDDHGSAEARKRGPEGVRSGAAGSGAAGSGAAGSGAARSDMTEPDAAPTDAAPTDAAPTDAAPTDAAPTDAALTDAALTDAALTDAAPTGVVPVEIVGSETTRPVAAANAAGATPSGSESGGSGPEGTDAAASGTGSGNLAPDPLAASIPAASLPPVPAPRPAVAPAGSSRTVAAAVAQALAVRAAASGEASPVPATAANQPARSGDARDRLLAVLLQDPQRAVGAAEELENCCGQMGEILARLARSGLRPDQLARLSGFPVSEVQALLAQQGASTPPAG